MMDGISGEYLKKLPRSRKALLVTCSALCHQILVNAKERCQNLGVPTIHLKSRSGDCAEVILETAHEINADAIFAGKRGRSRLAGTLLGSVSQKLATLAPCIVAIVP